VAAVARRGEEDVTEQDLKKGNFIDLYTFELCPDKSIPDVPARIQLDLSFCQDQLVFEF